MKIDQDKISTFLVTKINHLLPAGDMGDEIKKKKKKKL